MCNNNEEERNGSNEASMCNEEEEEEEESMWRKVKIIMCIVMKMKMAKYNEEEAESWKVVMYVKA